MGNPKSKRGMRRHRYDTLSLAAGLIFILLCGCSGQRPLTFGIYSVPKGELGRVREMGLDFVVGPKDQSYLDAAAKLDLGVIARGQGEGRLLQHPSVIGAYLSDEPDLRGIAPSEIKKEFRAAKKISSKRVFVNLSSAYSIEAYRDAGDVVMFDWYPIGWQPLETFYAHLRAARLGAGSKPFYAVIQTFDWSKYPQLMPVSGEYRRPTPSEVKAMTLWAAMSGARGIAFYPYDDGHSSIHEAPELMRAIKETVELIRSNEKFFTQQREWIAYPFRFEKRTDQYNAIWDASIAIKASQRRGSPGQWLIIAANTTDREIAVSPQPAIKFSGLSGRIVFGPLEVKLLEAEISR